MYNMPNLNLTITLRYIANYISSKIYKILYLISSLIQLNNILSQCDPLITTLLAKILVDI